MSENDKIINPDEWSETELIKYSYREIKRLNQNFSKIEIMIEEKNKGLDVRVSELEKDLQKRKGFYAATALIAGFLGSLRGMFIDFVKTN